MQTAETRARVAVPEEGSFRPSTQRYLALDAYRGFIMPILVSGGFGLAELAKCRPEFLPVA